MKFGRKVVTLDEVREDSLLYAQTRDDSLGIMALVDVENMGWCKDGVTRWYHFELGGKPCVFYKR